MPNHEQQSFGVPSDAIPMADIDSSRSGSEAQRSVLPIFRGSSVATKNSSISTILSSIASFAKSGPEYTLTNAFSVTNNSGTFGSAVIAGSLSMSNHTRDTESLVSQFHDRKIDNPTFAEQIWGQMVATPPELEGKKLTEEEHAAAKKVFEFIFSQSMARLSMDTSEGHQNCEYIVRAREAVEPEFIAISNELGTHGCWRTLLWLQYNMKQLHMEPKPVDLVLEPGRAVRLARGKQFWRENEKPKEWFYWFSSYWRDETAARVELVIHGDKHHEVIEPMLRRLFAAQKMVLLPSLYPNGSSCHEDFSLATVIRHYERRTTRLTEGDLAYPLAARELLQAIDLYKRNELEN